MNIFKRLMVVLTLLSATVFLGGCGTRIWGEGGTNATPHGGISVPLGKGK